MLFFKYLSYLVCLQTALISITADATTTTSSSKTPSFFELIGECPGGINGERHQIRRNDRKILLKLAAEYNENLKLLHTKQPLSPVMIPKKLHIIWIGPKPFPEESIANVKSWRKHNPDWEMHFWTDSYERPLPIPDMIRRMVTEYDFHPLTEYIAATSNWGEKSDLMRFCCIYNEGGFYADHDAECLQSFEPFTKNFSFVACLERPHYHAGINTSVIPANGLFGAVAGHIILQKTFKHLHSVWGKVEKEFPTNSRRDIIQRVIRRTFDSFAAMSIEWRNHGDYKDCILPTSYFYADNILSKKKIRSLKKSSILFSSHKFAGSWISDPTAPVLPSQTGPSTLLNNQK